MKAALKGELLKLLSVRSTYVVVLLGLLLSTILAFYFEGWKGSSGSAAATLQSTALSELFINASGVAKTLLPIVAILFVAHEYRYNTITYTLTSVNRRLKVFFAKVLVAVAFSLAASALIVAVTMLAYFAGLSLRDASLPAQEFPFLELAGKAALYISAYSLIGLVLAFIFRNIVAGIALLFIAPGLVEALLALLLKDKSMYLPFTALESLIRPMGALPENALSAATAAVVSVLYLAAFLAIAAVLFVRRDAT